MAMSSLGGECVFASEIDRFAIDTYGKNFGINAAFDITQTDERNIPSHDVLCAGFPCQAFSKAGKQNGFDDTRGTLFFDILRILQYHKPKYILLENVRNLVSHDAGNTWRVIRKHLLNLGYIIPSEPIIISPHQIGIPQLRERVFIPGVFAPNANANELSIEIPLFKRNTTSAHMVLCEPDDESFRISDYEEFVLGAWDEFLQGLTQRVLGFPIWATEFGSTCNISDLPQWKQDFIQKNRELYNDNKKHIDSWLKKYNYLKDFVPTHRKFEWQAGITIKSVWEGIIQFRPSGVRVKRPTEFPALVAMVHVPILGWAKRRITPREAANLQGFPLTYKINVSNQQAYKQFGNSVNVEVVKYIAKQLFAS